MLEVLSLLLGGTQSPPPKPTPAAEVRPAAGQAIADGNTEAMIAFLLFVASEAVGMSKLKDNSLLQLILHMGQELFPYELRRKEPATRQNRPRARRDNQGRYVRRDE